MRDHTAMEPVFIDTLTGPTQHFVIALSGGIDSSVLLALCHDAARHYPQHEFRAVHVNHGLHADADRWEDFCANQSHRYGIPFSALSVTVERQGSLESAAREARYQALFDDMKPAEILLLAHHQTDQLETVLLQLKRGAGPKGLAAMAPMYWHARGIQVQRPLLGWEQASIEALAEQRKLQWIEDPSNQDTRMDRNFLRHEVLPLLLQRWPQMSKAADRSARLCAQQQDLLDEVIQHRLAGMCDDDGCLLLQALAEHTLPWQQALLRGWLEQRGAPTPSLAQLQEMLSIQDSRDDAQPDVRWGGWQVRRFRDVLYVDPINQTRPQNTVLSVPGTLSLPGGATMTLSRQASADGVAVGLDPDQPCDVVFDHFSARFQPHDEPFSKPLKQWFKAWGIPPWQRSDVVQLRQQGQIVALIRQQHIVPAARNDSRHSQCFVSIES
ncbi:tRNA lysidine(34) synthetase TilS [Aestuariibacter halophilus]|uniref:tRNA(Ile)-lysidine synthase n=1 Tax=Fluctibacter halophilus TaxID=226011 RepID=A0ABS8GG75_9ALTE|nr:tRNA lysidine(34) synthetase TilS [Aestuariibacter halophilus]MCC2618181.1 tRNA lysidine(34) synthetase TilS [Aestuariibacter halophilus]